MNAKLSSPRRQAEYGLNKNGFILSDVLLAAVFGSFIFLSSAVLLHSSLDMVTKAKWIRTAAMLGRLYLEENGQHIPAMYDAGGDRYLLTMEKTVVSHRYSCHRLTVEMPDGRTKKFERFINER